MINYSISLHFPVKVLFLLWGLLWCNLSAAQIFVDGQAAGKNNGTSWADAFTNLQDALDEAPEGAQVWVARGTYLPGSPGDPKTTHFFLTKGIRLYGGFDGTEKRLSERNPALFPSVLSGDVSQDDIAGDNKQNRKDNVYTILLVESKGSVIPVIDGFIFEGGHSDNQEGPASQKNGGGLFTYTPIKLRHCEFKGNYAIENGGGLYFLDSSFDAPKENLLESGYGKDPMFIDSCRFTNNLTEVYGGALYATLEDKNSTNFFLGHSSFVKNKSIKVGGAVYLGIENSNSIVEVGDCSFEKNEGELGGAVLFSIWSSNVKLRVNNCNFLENKSHNNFPDNLTAGGALRFSVQQSSSAFSGYIKGCTFSKNSTALHGGGISTVVHLGSNSTFLTIDSCELKNNKANTGGGIAVNLGGQNDSLLIRDCLFQDNVSSGDGGAIGVLPRNSSNFTTIYNSHFSGNEATGAGAAFYFPGDQKSYDLKNCTFQTKDATEVQQLLSGNPVFNPFMLFLFIQGALWMQILYSLLMFFMTREKTTLYYTLLMVGFSMLYFWMNDVQYFSDVESLFFASSLLSTIFSQGSVVLIIVGFIKFTQHYLNINQLYPSLKRYIFYFLIAFVVVDLIWVVTILTYSYYAKPFWIIPADILYQLSILAGVIIPFIAAVYLSLKGNRPARFLLPALFLLSISGVLMLVYVSRFFASGDIYFLLSQIFTLLALTAIAMANGYRTNLLKKEEERADRLSELDLAKTRLYNNITHEFRTPLTVIMGSADMIRGNQQEKQLIQRNSKQLLQLINQMLDLSKLEGGALKLESKQGNIISFIEYLVESFQSLATSKHISLTFFTELEALRMDFDAEKIQTIISNLISNAIKFTPVSGKVVLHARTEEIKKSPHLVLAIRDSGTGIAEEDIPHIFDRFFQVDASDMRSSGGSGIGLALVRELVQLMKGSIEVTSKLGKGSVFTVRVPITRTAALQHGKPQNELIDAAKVPTTADENAGSFFSFAGELPLALIIEDNRDVVSFLRSCLQHKYQLEIAYNGREGIEKALETIPDVIISDVMMPEADGYTVCKTLKTDERTSHVPIILLTAKATQEDKVRGLDVGADAYLQKPFHREELETRLQKLIELRKTLQDRYKGVTGLISTPVNKEDAFVKKLKSIIEENIEDESFGIAELCRSVGLSRMQVHRKLKALTDMPTTAFINLIRLQRGYELLSKTDLNVSEVAYKVGFSDPSYFTRLFTKQFGKPPSEIHKKG